MDDRRHEEEVMMTNVKIELTDEQRRNLQRQLTGKSKPITRAELCEFVDGIVRGALECEARVHNPPVPCFSPSGDLTVMPERYARKYADESDAWKQGWLRGWNAVGSAVK
jgi:hypothetical protein